MGDRPVLSLDEPTSQLDPMAESELYSEFAKLAENKTSLFITHRLGSTRITDRILVISEGRVVDTGTHEELLERGGILCRYVEGPEAVVHMKKSSGVNVSET